MQDYENGLIQERMRRHVVGSSGDGNQPLQQARRPPFPQGRTHEPRLEWAATARTHRANSELGMNTILPDNVSPFLARFYNFYDALLVSVAYDWLVGGGTCVSVTMLVRDQLTADQSFVRLRLN